MCTKVYDLIPKFATRNLYGYKLVEKHDKYWKPFYVRDYNRYPYNEIIYDTKSRKNYCFGYEYGITQGYFHSSRKIFKNLILPNNVICIPKGTEYFDGINEEVRCSRGIIVFKTRIDYLAYMLFGKLRKIKGSDSVVTYKHSKLPVPRKYRRKH